MGSKRVVDATPEAPDSTRRVVVIKGWQEIREPECEGFLEGSMRDLKTMDVIMWKYPYYMLDIKAVMYKHKGLRFYKFQLPGLAFVGFVVVGKIYEPPEKWRWSLYREIGGRWPPRDQLLTLVYKLANKLKTN